MNIKEAAERLGFNVRGNLTNCFNKVAHTNGDSHPSLVLYENSYKCMACGINGNKAELVKQVLNIEYSQAMEWLGENNDSFLHNTEKKYKLPTTVLSPINSEVINYLGKRGIKEETVNKFGLGYIDKSIMFPYYKNGKLVNIKYRLLAEKKFRKEKDAISTLWNQDNIKGKRLVICEGEIDVMSLCEYDIESVSVPSGVNDLTWIENDWDFLLKFGQIYIVMDNDSAGQSAVSKLVERLGKWRCYNVKLPYKDPNECLMKGLLAEDIEEIFNEAESYDLAELKSPKDFGERLKENLRNPLKLVGRATSSIELTNILKGWRKQEVTVWTGQNGSGKSTFLSQEILGLIDKDEKVAIGSFEMSPVVYLGWLGQQYCGRQFHHSEVDKFTYDLHGKLFVVDILGNISQEKLFEIMEFGYKKHGIEIFVIDSLMKVDLTSDNNKFYGEQKKFVSKLKDFAMNFNSHIHLVAHSRKGTNDDSVMGKTDVSGSGDITNLADNVIVLHRYSENSTYSSSLFVKKNRQFGTLGKVNYDFDVESRTFRVAKINTTELDEFFGV